MLTAPCFTNIFRQGCLLARMISGLLFCPALMKVRKSSPGCIHFSNLINWQRVLLTPLLFIVIVQRVVHYDLLESMPV